MNVAVITVPLCVRLCPCSYPAQSTAQAETATPEETDASATESTDNEDIPNLLKTDDFGNLYCIQLLGDYTVDTENHSLTDN